MFGYMGKILRVNLTTSEVTTEALDFELAKKFIGWRTRFRNKVVYG